MVDFDYSSIGGSPTGSLIEYSNGTLYGMTTTGGTGSSGTLFVFDMESNELTKKYDFDGSSNGKFPFGTLEEGSDGNLYGTTVYGGTNDVGIMFQFNPNTDAFVKKIDFSSSYSGAYPYADLLMASDGFLYGLTRMGGVNDDGVLYKYDISSNSYYSLKHFDQKLTGQFPEGGLVELIIEGVSEGLFGLATAGGTNVTNYGFGIGTIFKFDIEGNYFQKKIDFGGSNDGYSPNGTLLHASNGMIYGVCSLGGAHGRGVLYEIDPSTNSYIKKIDFEGTINGDYPVGGLIEGSNGKIYGTTKKGGVNSNGTLFEYDYLTNTLSKIVDFDNENTAGPYGSLLEASNNKLYGMTWGDGNVDRGVLFEYNYSNSIFSELYNFNGETNGAYPRGNLIEAANGILYGMTSQGGANDEGVLFGYDITNSTLTKKVDFNAFTKGESPYGALVEASNGKLYGMTSDGGLGGLNTSGVGVLFEFDPFTDTFLKKLDFNYNNNTGGKGGYGNLFESSNGRLYGMTHFGGDDNTGVLFEYDYVNNQIIDKLSFNGENGSNPEYGGLIEIENSNFTWLGMVDSSWHNPLNWAGESIPSSFDNVVIPTGRSNYPTIVSIAVCNNLTLKSDATGDASLIEYRNLNASGSITCERYISRFASATSGWHYLSSPMKNIDIASSDFVPSAKVDDFFRWDETTGLWKSFNGDSFGHNEFELGTGYLVGYTKSAVKSFEGVLNDTLIVKNLSYTPSAGDGYNLIGNPYSSAIIWDSIILTDGMDGSYYVVDPSNGTYLVSNGVGGDIPSGEIPMNQAFLVKSNSIEDSIIIKPNAQVHSNNSFNKATKSLNDYLMISLNGEHSKNKTYIQFREDATSSYDNKIDAYKLFGFADIAQLYTESNNEQYAINCLDYSEEAISIPIGIYLKEDENLNFEFNGLASFSGNMSLQLEDKKLDKLINLKQSPNYFFKGEVTDESSRFVLHVNSATRVSELTETRSVLVYSVGQEIFINSSEAINARVSIYNMNGQLLSQSSIIKEELKKVDMSFSTGVYVVNIQNESFVWNQKVFIK